MGLDVSAAESSGMDAGVDRAERLNEDDQAARAAQRFLEGSLLSHRRATAQQPGTPGICRNCGERSPTLAIYCDDDCRTDHERRARRWKA